MTATALGIACRHHRRQDTDPHFHVAGVWLKPYQARICLDCDAELCQSGTQCPGPEQQDTVHIWQCQQCGYRWQSVTTVRKAPLLQLKKQQSPVRCRKCRAPTRIKHACPKFGQPDHPNRQPGNVRRFLRPDYLKNRPPARPP